MFSTALIVALAAVSATATPSVSVSLSGAKEVADVDSFEVGSAIV